MRIKEISEPRHDLFIERLDRGHEIGPVAKRSGDGATMGRHNGQLLANNVTVVIDPHPWPANARPEIHANPIAVFGHRLPTSNLP
jgi:hypothetical protein